MLRIGLDVPRSGIAHSIADARRIADAIGTFPLIIRPAFTLGGSGGGIAYNREEFDEIVERGLALSPVTRSPDRGIAPRLEGIRDGGDARSRGQLRGHLLDREFRSDGRAHRRFDHRRARPDADRPGIPDDARRLVRGHPRDRRRDRRLEHPVCRQSGERPHGRDRDESARLAFLRAGLEGDRISDREDRGQAGRRLHARRNPQRHHARNAGEFRADDRLLRGQSPALHFREIPAGRRDADHADEKRGRSDGDRPHVQGSAAKGVALARDQALRFVRRWQREAGRCRDACA